MTATQLLRAAIQRLLDESGDGWVVDQFVVSLGLQRMNGDHVESTAWVWAPGEQPDWQTDGLLQAALDLRADADIEND